jgi:hypothetical protein
MGSGAARPKGPPRPSQHPAVTYRRLYPSVPGPAGLDTVLGFPLLPLLLLLLLLLPPLAAPPPRRRLLSKRPAMLLMSRWALLWGATAMAAGAPGAAGLVLAAAGVRTATRAVQSSMMSSSSSCHRLCGGNGSVCAGWKRAGWSQGMEVTGRRVQVQS